MLIATDGSDLAIDAARRGLNVLAPDCEVTLLSVIASVPGDDAGGIEGPVLTQEEVEREWTLLQREAKDALHRTEAVLPASVKAKRRIEVGGEGPTICTIAADERSEVIVIGSHGRGLLGRIVHLGSVSEHVMRHAPCPVLVVRPSEGSDKS